MRKEEKLDIINAISAQLEETPNFYITDIAGLNAGKTHELRKACFEAGVKLVVVKNTLFTKVLEASGNEEMAKLTEVLAGPTAIMFNELLHFLVLRSLENFAYESILCYYELNTSLKASLAECVSLAGVESCDVSDVEVRSLLQL